MQKNYKLKHTIERKLMTEDAITTCRCLYRKFTASILVIPQFSYKRIIVMDSKQLVYPKSFLSVSPLEFRS